MINTNLFESKIGSKVVYPERWYTGEVVKIAVDVRNTDGNFIKTIGIKWDHQFGINGNIQYVSYTEYINNISWQQLICYENDKDLLQIKLKL
jgi:hypothetical protein